MSPLETTLIAAGVGSAFSILGMLVNSYLTWSRERRQQVWKSEVSRILELEERAGQIVEIVCSHRGFEQKRDLVRDDLQRLERDAGRLPERLEKGDNVVVSELSRLGRSMLECMEVLSVAMEKGIHVYAVKGSWRLDDSIQSKIVAMAFSMAA